MAWGTVELEPEVRDWLEGLSTAPFARAAFYIDLLAEHGPLLDEPYTRQLDGQLRELRFHIGRSATRITYWIASGRRIILLTVFTKTRMREDRQVDRARRALTDASPPNTTPTRRTRWPPAAPAGPNCATAA